MRPSFLLSADLRPVSALVRKADADAIPIGTSVTVVTPYTTPYGEIAAGTKGFVEYVDPESGLMEILMEGIEPALLHWGNLLILVPFDTDDLAACLVCALRHIPAIIESISQLSNVA